MALKLTWRLLHTVSKEGPEVYKMVLSNKPIPLERIHLHVNSLTRKLTDKSFMTLMTVYQRSHQLGKCLKIAKSPLSHRRGEGVTMPGFEL
jgi:hypothetical protein